MKPFLVQVIQRIQEKHHKWDEVVIILPSKRAGFILIIIYWKTSIQFN